MLQILKISEINNLILTTNRKKKPKTQNEIFLSNLSCSHKGRENKTLHQANQHFPTHNLEQWTNI